MAALPMHLQTNPNATKKHRFDRGMVGAARVGRCCMDFEAPICPRPETSERRRRRRFQAIANQTRSLAATPSRPASSGNRGVGRTESGWRRAEARNLPLPPKNGRQRPFQPGARRRRPPSIRSVPKHSPRKHSPPKNGRTNTADRNAVRCSPGDRRRARGSRWRTLRELARTPVGLTERFLEIFDANDAVFA